MVGFWSGISLGLQMVTFLLRLHMAFPQHISPLSLVKGPCDVVRLGLKFFKDSFDFLLQGLSLGEGYTGARTSVYEFCGEQCSVH